ncbi:gliding motility lipoprotein GldH [Olivibacter sp. SDN3]|uniref:gliding motility lipoprotein GldH n=1 Tax=Olivibacter sp. SDN3 TaxID=2764720 RepID=UPI00165142B2|nr:gliding motility lipoprotein GldH [Olivibacter sp. SDN3]QNL50710.1 gliding motility lipoprotein GldH [Olivibacter sp. SDN3]
MIIVSVMGGCSDQALLDEFKAIPNQSWNYSDIPTFDVQVKDKDRAYKLKINVRITADYRYANLFLLVHQKGPGMEESLTKRVELKVADKDGRWLGKGAGSLYSYQIAYDNNYLFPDTGTYAFRLEQNMRDNPLKGISDIGFCVEPRNVPK